jgi:hypothetical protein
MLASKEADLPGEFGTFAGLKDRRLSYLMRLDISLV